MIDNIQQAILDKGALSIKDMEKIMSKIKAELHSRSKISKVNSIVKSQLS